MIAFVLGLKAFRSSSKSIDQSAPDVTRPSEEDEDEEGG